MTNDRDNDRWLAYAFWHNDHQMIQLMMCTPGETYMIKSKQIHKIGREYVSKYLVKTW